MFFGLGCALGCGAGRADCLRDARYDAEIRAALEAVFHMHYAAAESLCVRLPERDPARNYFAGLADLDRFADLGDTAALRRAELNWLALDTDSAGTWQVDAASRSVYRGLAEFQLSYIATLRGERLRATRLAFGAQHRLARDTAFAEARAALALFDYYRLRLLEHLNFLPFVDVHSELPLHRLEAAADSSRYLKDVLMASAFWIHFDRGEFDAALRSLAGFLTRYPHNRVVRQMRADVWYRAGRWAEAQDEYQNLLREYARLRDSLPKTCLPLGYYCAAGNLARIDAAMGQKASAAHYWREWRRADSLGLGPWLPASLKRALTQEPAP